MESTRQQKISRLIQKELGELFRVDSRDHYSGAMITVTKVYVTRDISVARVYLSIFIASKKDEVFEKIGASAKEIRYKLGQQTRNLLRSVPELEFYIDDSLDYIENIERLLKK